MTGERNPIGDALLWEAWCVIANVSEGRWSEQPIAWQDAAINWRSKWHAERYGEIAHAGCCPLAEPTAEDRAHKWMGDHGAELAGKGDRYLPRGGVRHRTRRNFYESSMLVAACGISVGEDYWRGTGTQAEYERLGAMPRCTRCIAAEGAAQ